MLSRFDLVSLATAVAIPLGGGELHDRDVGANETKLAPRTHVLVLIPVRKSRLFDGEPLRTKGLIS